MWSQYLKDLGFTDLTMTKSLTFCQPGALAQVRNVYPFFACLSARSRQFFKTYKSFVGHKSVE